MALAIPALQSQTQALFRSVFVINLLWDSLFALDAVLLASAWFRQMTAALSQAAALGQSHLEIPDFSEPCTAQPATSTESQATPYEQLLPT